MGIDDVFAVIAEGTRRQILKHLRDGDKAVGELVVELQVSQPTVSKHLKVLREAGLVSMRAQGQKRYYSLDTAPLGLVRDWLAEFEPRAVQPGVPEPAGGNAQAAAGPEAGSGAGPDAEPAAVPDAAPAAGSEAVPDAVPDTAPEVVSGAVAEATPAEVGVLAAAVLAGPEVPTEPGAPRPQIGRTMGRAAERAADLLSQLRRRRDS